MKGNGSNSPFGFGGAYTTIISKIFDVLMLGVLWLICSLPFLTIGASTTALYYAVVKSVKNDTGYASTMFFKSFRQNFRQATILWLVTAAAFFVLRLNTGILMAKTDGMFGLVMIGFYTAAAVYVVLTAAYMFPALSRFEMDTFWFLRISLYMTARYFLTSLILAVIFAMAAVLAWRIPLLILILPGPVTFLVSEFMERVLSRHMPDKE
ncbi:MAG: YesL family protein [Blautia sp.]|nr:YesL family protein [Blautia sp.]